jgi:DNA uptake protein ComE-like DNA-binding protein
MHRKDMPGRAFISALIFSFVLTLVACSNQSPDQIRQKTAEETAAVKRDSKAVAQGIKDGLSNKRAIDLNRASKSDLESLPGINTRTADRIIAERPYANTHQLVTRRILSEDEYAQLQDRVVVNK